jgi:large subunit ribosomal protein L20
LKLSKGNFGSRGNVWTVAKNTVEQGLQYAYAHRQIKKRTYRSLWITRINAAVRAYGMTYSEFMGKVNAKGIALNRKVMADLAMNEPKAFEAIVNAVK